ncbi:Hypothetical protein NTJ_15146 [Nesidiocoris tenuis]|uniref:Uncharacterized protein n=1 Tax=Nesidiocoris tenuis TaxID=355587 RepID=A0ABN7BD78_9HEMI|nr:Hypothetical protein NTJ_15146 [Nesidiocoris tenuis]
MSPLKVSITATIVRHGGEKFKFLNFLTSVTVGSLSQSNDRIILPEPDGLAVASGSTRSATDCSVSNCSGTEQVPEPDVFEPDSGIGP